MTVISKHNPAIAASITAWPLGNKASPYSELGGPRYPEICPGLDHSISSEEAERLRAMRSMTVICKPAAERPISLPKATTCIKYSPVRLRHVFAVIHRAHYDSRESK